jgi:hypothetical protein
MVPDLTTKKIEGDIGDEMNSALLKRYTIHNTLPIDKEAGA